MFKSDEYRYVHKRNSTKMWNTLENRISILSRRSSEKALERWKKSFSKTASTDAYKNKQKRVQTEYLKNHPDKVLKHKNHMINRWKDQTSVYHSEEFREKLRLARIREIRRLGVKCSNFNPTACEYFDYLNKNKGWELQHAKNGGEVVIGGYFLDAYDKNRNIVVEYDEPSHYVFGGNLKIKDTVRQNRIIQILNPIFFRYNETENMLYEVTAPKGGK